MPTLYPLMPWGPAIDGSPTGLPDLPVTLLQRGQYNKVPTIFGMCFCTWVGAHAVWVDVFVVFVVWKYVSLRRAPNRPECSGAFSWDMETTSMHAPGNGPEWSV
jgi:hypothetical protein